MLFGNIDDGYLEGMLRGYRAGILTSSDYANLCQCESIEGARPAASAFGLQPPRDDAHVDTPATPQT